MVVPVYNGAKFLSRCLDTLQQQTFTDFQVIFVDDGSTDETISILKSYDDKRIHIYHHRQIKRHRYYGALYAATSNFGNALEYASGDYIFLSDQDDIWHPRKIDNALNVLVKNGGVCAADFYVITESKKRIGYMHYVPKSFGKKNLYGFSCGFAREELKYILPMPNVPQHDLFIQLIAMKRHKLTYIDKVCALHRWNGENTSYTGNNVPVVRKVLSRIKLISIVLWRCMTR